MRLLKALSLAAAIGAWVVIVIGGYVSHTESGLGCPDPVLCPNPSDPRAAAIEGAHRLAAWAEGFVMLALLVLVWWRYHAWTRVRQLTVLGFELVVLQAVLGIVAVATYLDVLVVTAHLAVASVFLVVMVLNAVTVFRELPPNAEGLARSATRAADFG